jgi:TolB protein
MASMTRLVLRVSVSLLTFSVVLSLCLIVLGRALPSQGEIVYMALGRGGVDLWILDPMRGVSLAIADHAFTATPMFPSPDGRQIAFFRETGGNAQLHIINVDGTQLRRLDEVTPDLAIAWLPNNQHIIASSLYGTNGQYDVWDLSFTRLPRNGIEACALPALSPDGQRIAGTLSVTGGSFFCRSSGISVVNSDGSGSLVQYLPDEYDLSAVWSPNDSRLAVYGSSGLYVIEDNAAHPPPDQLIQNRLVAAPVWSPDGTRLAVVMDSVFDLYFVPVVPEMGSPVNLTPLPGIEAYPTWSPDGRHIAYASTLRGNTEIYTVDVETGAIQQVTMNTTHELNLVWLP